MSDERELSLADLSLADLIADAACVHLPAPRAAAATRVIDLTAVPHVIQIPEATRSLVEDYALGV